MARGRFRNFKLVERGKDFLSYLLGLFSNDMGIDLGTATTLVYAKGEGVVLCEPSVVAVEKGKNHVLAVGQEGKRMLGRTPGNIIAIRPMKDGVIADFEITEAMLRYFIKKVHNRQVLVRPRMVIAIPSGITEVEKRAVKDSAERAGAREVYLVEEPVAAAIGVGLPISEPTASMIIDIGGGTSEIAVISLGGIVNSKSIRIGGDEMDQAVSEYLKKTYNLMVGERTAEEIKIKIGSAFSLDEEKSIEVRGRDLIVGLPKTVTITSEEIRDALKETISAIIDAVKMVLERTPPELSSDLIELGIVMAGGGSLLKGLDRIISDETGLPVHIADDPITAVVLGTGKILNEIRYLKRVTVPSRIEI
ncbi:MAG: rod shape-determining protein [Candidatus Gygaella obscura]|nr:rod shape-determining protein [Candidatus Gygaella obscura]